MSKIVKITYDSASYNITIVADDKAFDTSRIDGRRITDWVYPFIFKNVRWNGIYDELKSFLGTEVFLIVFEGSDTDLQALKNAIKDTPAKVASLDNKVVILYKREPLSTKITVNGKIFDTTRIQNRTIDEWVYPFQFNNVKWDGIFTEIENELGINTYEISFVGEQTDMKELMSNCPENVDLIYKAPAAPKAPVSGGGALAQKAAASGGALLSGAKDKLGALTQNNDNAQKAKDAVANAGKATVNAGKKIDEGIINTVANIKNSEKYQKVMENEKVRKVMENEQVQKVSSFWNKLDKKIKYAIGIVAALAIISVPLILIFGGNDLELEPEAQLSAMKCKHKCDAGYVGFMGEGEEGKGRIYKLYFKGKDHNIVYLIESEDGKSSETTAAESEIYERESSDYNYDTSVYGKDADGDGYVEFTISEFVGDGYDEICTIRGKVK